ncbi:MAG: hypothetical protein EBR69_03735 [Synechococcaceae bacterium WB4_2_0805]|jgi:hypothetical protein|nr:hypothetical protein [Synechococcaceae bacterium WB4_2_0805]
MDIICYFYNYSQIISSSPIAKQQLKSQLESKPPAVFAAANKPALKSYYQAEYFVRHALL